jgi:hypothetical protein
MPKTLAVVQYLDLQSNPEYFKELTIGKQKHKLYSPKAVTSIKEVLEDTSIEEIWETHRPGRRNNQK